MRREPAFVEARRYEVSFLELREAQRVQAFLRNASQELGNDEAVVRPEQERVEHEASFARRCLTEELVQGGLIERRPHDAQTRDGAPEPRIAERVQHRPHEGMRPGLEPLQRPGGVHSLDTRERDREPQLDGRQPREPGIAGLGELPRDVLQRRALPAFRGEHRVGVGDRGKLDDRPGERAIAP